MPNRFFSIYPESHQIISSAASSSPIESHQIDSSTARNSPIRSICINSPSFCAISQPSSTRNSPNRSTVSQFTFMANSQEKVHSWVFIPQFLKGDFSSIVPYPNETL